MKDLAAIDFETANFERTNMCSAGMQSAIEKKNSRHMYIDVRERYKPSYLSALSDAHQLMRLQ